MQRNGAEKGPGPPSHPAQFFGAVAHLEQQQDNTMVVLSDAKGCFPNTDIMEAFKSLCKNSPEMVGHVMSAYGESGLTACSEQDPTAGKLPRVFKYLGNGLVQG